MVHRLNVMISSTASDLPDHRKQVIAACERLGYLPLAMENMHATDKDPVRASLSLVEQADLYVGIFAYRYGYVPNGYDRSITEMEYDHACASGLPCLVYFMHEDHSLKATAVETGQGAEKLQRFKERLAKAHVAGFFKNPDDLRAQVIHALTSLKKVEPQPLHSALHRTKTLPHLTLDGRFTRQALAGMAGQEQSEAGHRLLLHMMVSCGICFPLHNLSGDPDNPEWLYAAPALLPEWDEARSRLLLGRLRGTPPDAAACVRYAFLHERILRTFLSRVGSEAHGAGVYWKYGCWFGEETTQSTILVRSSQAPTDGAPWSGEVTLEAWGDKADELVERVLKMLLAIPLGHPPQVERTTPPPARRPEEMRREEGPPPTLIGAAHAVGVPGKSKQVFVSYAWGEDKTAEGRRHEQEVERLCRRVEGWSYEVIRDKERLRPGDLISEFMRLAGRTPRVLVILNAKYLRSVFCMTELHEVYRCCHDSKEFQRRIVPLPLPGVVFYSIRERCDHGLYWEKEVEALAPLAGTLRMAPKDYDKLHHMNAWAKEVAVMLELMADMVLSNGFNDDPEKIRARLA